MAGRPGRRARLEAEARAAATPLSWTDQFNAEVKAAVEADAVADEMRADRVRLEQWWRDQMEAVERSIEERRDMLADSGEHPSEIFAHQARKFGALGIPRDVAATLLEISDADFENWYGNEYTVGSAETMVPVAQNLLRMATSMNDRVAVKAATEFLNRRGGEEWRPPAQKLEIDDGRAPKRGVIDSSRLSWEDRELMRGVLQRALTGRTIEASGVAGEITSESEDAE